MINLGDFRLEPYEVSSFAVTEEDNYAEFAVVEGTPVRQYIGPNLSKISIGVLFEAYFAVPAERLAALKKLKNKAFAVSNAAGQQYGRYTIDSITVTSRTMTATGSVRGMTVQVELTAEGAEPTLADKTRAKQQSAPARKVSADDTGSFRR